MLVKGADGKDLNRMAKPSFSVESFAAAASIPQEDVDIKNLTVAPLNFKEFAYMTNAGVCFSSTSDAYPCSHRK